MAADYIPRSWRLHLTAAVVAAVALLSAVPGARAASSFYIRGGGNGHGIGMSQYGAYGYALHGRSYRWILTHYYRGTSIGNTDPTQVVRVLLSTGSAAFSGASSAPGKKLQASQTYTVTANADGTLTLNDQRGKKVGSFRAPLTVRGREPLTLAGVGTYRGSFQFRPDGSGGVQTVDAVALDDYVRGVISAEMPSSWSMQALETQAVAARTYAITTDVSGSSFDLYKDTRSQMYGGVAAETPSTDAAVAATRGQVVTYHGSPAVTYFFSSSGGHTENIENVWLGAAPEQWLKGVPDRYDGAGRDPYHRWGRDLSIARASTFLKPYLKGALVGVRVTKHGVSPRVVYAQVVGTKGVTNVTGPQLQSAFGLLSTYASFTTITTLAGRAPHLALSIAAMLDTVIGAAVRGVHGSVYVAGRGEPIAIQLRRGRRWRTVVRTRTMPDGEYDSSVPRPGTYRIVYRGLNGPAIRIR